MNKIPPALLLSATALWSLDSRSAGATVISIAEGKPFVAAATGALVSEGIKFIPSGVAVGLAVAKEEAWTFNYAFTPFGSEIKSNTTLSSDRNTASITATKAGFFRRMATAMGSATKAIIDGQGKVTTPSQIKTNANANKTAVAKSIAGVGTELQSTGATLGGVLTSVLSSIVLDPIDAILPPQSPPIPIPGESILNQPGWPDSVAFATNPNPVAGFFYEIDKSDLDKTTGQFGDSKLLFRADGRLSFDPNAINNNTGGLAISLDKRNTIVMGAGNFTEASFEYFNDSTTSRAGFQLMSPIEFNIRADTLCQPGGGFGSCEDFVITVSAGVFAAATDFDEPTPIPEPSSAAMLGLGIVAVILSAQKRVRPRASVQSGQN